MAYTQLEYFLRGTPPNIYFTYHYEITRSGADVKLRFKTAISAVTGESWFAGYLSQAVSIDGTAADSRVIKAQGIDQWSAFSAETPELTVQNKTSGSLSVSIASTTNDIDFTSPLTKTYSIAVPPAASVITQSSDFNFEDAFSVAVTKYDASFADTLKVYVGGLLVKTVEDYASGSPVTLSDAELLAAYGATAAGQRTADVAFTTTTMSGETLVGVSAGAAVGTAAGTARINVSGTWKRGVAWLNSGGTWTRALMHINDSGTWKRGC
jgi:hypothetical protein